MSIQCDAIKCLWNANNICSKETIAIKYQNIYQYNQIVDTVPICVSFSNRESAGHLDMSHFPKR